MTNIYVVKEYDCFVRGTDHRSLSDKYKPIPKKVFDALENFILSNSHDTETNPIELMSITSKKGLGKLIHVKNYVGLISMKDGTQIEILPKIYSKEGNLTEEKTRKIFLMMLKSLKEFPFKQFQLSSLGVMKHTIFEVFIQMFIQQVMELTKKGLKSSYLMIEENERFYKGKILFTEHIKKNVTHKERFYLTYDVFSQNRPENRLIKATLKKLYPQSKSYRNKKLIQQLLIDFEQVVESINYTKDFDKVKSDRSMKDYDLILSWCRLFLFNKSFTSFSGDEVAYALLFPMEKVFEAYVASILKKRCGSTYTIQTQAKTYHLFDQPQKFRLIPDIILTSTDSRVIVLDTKWKLLHNNPRKNYGISQTDMYQMYAYAKKLNTDKVLVVYPYNEQVRDIGVKTPTYVSNDDVRVEIRFLDLENVSESLETIVESLNDIL